MVSLLLLEPGHRCQCPGRQLMQYHRSCKADVRLRLPRALFVTMQTQLLAAFMTINLCLAALFE